MTLIDEDLGADFSGGEAKYGLVGIDDAEVVPALAQESWNLIPELGELGGYDAVGGFGGQVSVSDHGHFGQGLRRFATGTAPLCGRDEGRGTRDEVLGVRVASRCRRNDVWRRLGSYEYGTRVGSSDDGGGDCGFAERDGGAGVGALFGGGGGGEVASDCGCATGGGGIGGVHDGEPA